MDANQFKNMVFLFSSKLHCLARNIVKTDTAAEDVVQDAFVKLWNKRHEITDIKNLQGYMTTMVKNMCLDQLRKRKEKSSNMYEEGKHQSYSDFKDQVEMNDQIRNVEEIISSLPELQRLVIYMKDIQQYENEEIGKLLNMNMNAVRVNLSRARAKVKHEMEKLNSYAT